MSDTTRKTGKADGDSDDSESSEADSRDGLDMTVHRKGGKKSYNGDLLPFDVSTVTPPPKYLGRFRLDPHTHCGDIVEYDGIHFLVKRVRMLYKYTGGKHRMVRKKIEVKSLARKALESYLEKALEES